MTTWLETVLLQLLTATKFSKLQRSNNVVAMYCRQRILNSTQDGVDGLELMVFCYCPSLGVQKWALQAPKVIAMRESI